MGRFLADVQMFTFAQLLAAIGVSDRHTAFNIFSSNGEEIDSSLFQPFRSDHFSFVVIQQGTFRLKLNLVTYTLGRNDLLMVSPHDVRQFEEVSADCAVKIIGVKADYLYTAGIHEKNLEAFAFFSSVLNPLLHLEEAVMQNIIRVLEALSYKKTLSSTLDYQREIQVSLFCAFIYDVAAHFRRSQRLEEIRITRKEELTMRFLKLLPGQFRSVRSVQAYAGMLHVSPKYLSQTLKDVSGKTAGDFIGEMLLMEAKILLNDPRLSIAEVSSHLNFSDQFSFSNYFKKHTGKSPTLYRKS